MELDATKERELSEGRGRAKECFNRMAVAGEAKYKASSRRQRLSWAVKNERGATRGRCKGDSRQQGQHSKDKAGCRKAKTGEIRTAGWVRL